MFVIGSKDKIDALNQSIQSALSAQKGYVADIWDIPKITISGEWCIAWVNVVPLPEGCTIVDTVEYPQEVEDEID